jgi:hypothetical protein
MMTRRRFVILVGSIVPALLVALPLFVGVRTAAEAPGEAGRSGILELVTEPRNRTVHSAPTTCSPTRLALSSSRIS